MESCCYLASLRESSFPLRHNDESQNKQIWPYRVHDHQGVLLSTLERQYYHHHGPLFDLNHMICGFSVHGKFNGTV